MFSRARGCYVIAVQLGSDALCIVINNVHRMSSVKWAVNQKSKDI